MRTQDSIPGFTTKTYYLQGYRIRITAEEKGNPDEIFQVIEAMSLNSDFDMEEMTEICLEVVEAFVSYFHATVGITLLTAKRILA